MSNRRLVPAELHSELAEYSSLLRALRTENTRDVTAQLSKPAPRFFTGIRRSIDEDGIDLDSGDDTTELDEPYSRPSTHRPTSLLHTTSDAPVAGPSDLNHPSNSQPATPAAGQKRKRTKSSRRKETTRTGRDLWTRWPLPMEDVEIPEFTLEEELVSLAKECFKRNPPPPIPDITYQPGGRSVSQGAPFIRNNNTADLDSNSDSDSDKELEGSSFSYHLTGIVSSFLSGIFALLSAQTQSGSASTHNRIQPMDWKSVMDALSIFGDKNTIDAKSLETTLRRLEALYGPYEMPTTEGLVPSEPPLPQLPKPISRMHSSLNSLTKLRASFDELEASLFTFPPRPPYDPKKEEEQKKKISKKRARLERPQDQPLIKQKNELKVEERREAKDRFKAPPHWTAGVNNLPTRRSQRGKTKSSPTPFPESEHETFDPTTVDISDEPGLWTLGLDKLREMVDFYNLDPEGRRTTVKGLIQLVLERSVQDELERQNFDPAVVDIGDKAALSELGAMKLRQLCSFHDIDPKRRYTVQYLVPLLLEKSRRDEVERQRRGEGGDDEDQDEVGSAGGGES